MTKPCSHCGESPRQVTSSGTVRTYCDGCAAESKKAWRLANADRNRANKRAWHAAHPESGNERSRVDYAANREVRLEQSHAYRKAHPEEARNRQRAYRATHRAERRALERAKYAASDRKLEQNRAFREANREYVRDYTRAWVAAHPERRREIGRAGAEVRRARLLGAFVERVDPATVWVRDEGVCHICGQPADRARWHMEHVVPLARGGEHSYANVKVAHPECNNRKGARLWTA